MSVRSYYSLQVYWKPGKIHFVLQNYHTRVTKNNTTMLNVSEDKPHQWFCTAVFIYNV